MDTACHVSTKKSYVERFSTACHTISDLLTMQKRYAYTGTLRRCQKFYTLMSKIAIKPTLLLASPSLGVTHVFAVFIKINDS